MDFRTLSRCELQVLCKRNNIRANVTNAAMAEALASLDLVDGINYEMAPIPFLVPAPTVTTRSTARRSVLLKTEVVVSNPVPAILRRSQRIAMQKALDQEPKALSGEDDIAEVKQRATSKMLQAKLKDDICEDDDLDEDEEWALNDDDSVEEIGSTDESEEWALNDDESVEEIGSTDETEEWALNDDDSAEETGCTDESEEVLGETLEENDTVFTNGTLHEFDDEVDTGPDQAVLNELLEDLNGISLNVLRATYKEFKDKEIICSSVTSPCTA